MGLIGFGTLLGNYAQTKQQQQLLQQEQARQAAEFALRKAQADEQLAASQQEREIQQETFAHEKNVVWPTLESDAKKKDALDKYQLTLDEMKRVEETIKSGSNRPEEVLPYLNQLQGSLSQYGQVIGVPLSKTYTGTTRFVPDRATLESYNDMLKNNPDISDADLLALSQQAGAPPLVTLKAQRDSNKARRDAEKAKELQMERKAFTQEFFKTVTGDNFLANPDLQPTLIGTLYSAYYGPEIGKEMAAKWVSIKGKPDANQAAQIQARREEGSLNRQQQMTLKKMEIASQEKIAASRNATTLKAAAMRAAAGGGGRGAKGLTPYQEMMQRNRDKATVDKSYDRLMGAFDEYNDIAKPWNRPAAIAKLKHHGSIMLQRDVGLSPSQASQMLRNRWDLGRTNAAAILKKAGASPKQIDAAQDILFSR